MKKINLIIFDLDGTLVDAYRAVASSLNHSFKEFGYEPLDDHTIQRSVGWGDRHLIARFVKEEDVDKVLSVYREHHKNALKTGTKFLPGAKEVLKKLQASGYKLAIASNRPTRYTHIILKHLHIQDMFDHVICGDMVARAKPAPDVLLDVLDNLAVDTSETLYVGDMTIDVETGSKANVQTAIVLTGSCTREEIESLAPFCIMESIYELENVIDKLNK